jgi:hypothetical protein
MERYSVLPNWYYKISRFKPLSCLTCLSFWIGAGVQLTTCQWMLAPLVGLASAALAIIIIKLTE